MDILNTITELEREFALFMAIGLLGYIGKRYHLFPGWKVPAFLRKEGWGIVRAGGLTFGIGYFLPDLLLLAAEKKEVMDILAQHQALARKGMHVVGVLLGYTGGSIGVDLIKLLYGLPVQGQRTTDERGVRHSEVQRGHP